MKLSLLQIEDKQVKENMLLDSGGLGSQQGLTFFFRWVHGTVVSSGVKPFETLEGEKKIDDVNGRSRLKSASAGWRRQELCPDYQYKQMQCKRLARARCRQHDPSCTRCWRARSR